MANPKIKIYDVATDETIEREMTDEEFAAWDAGNKAKAAAEAAELAKRQAALAKLATLGLTIDDLQSLGLGGN